MKGQKLLPLLLGALFAAPAAHASVDLIAIGSISGPNAVPFNSAIDDTASYINRFHTLHLSLAPSDAGSPLPFTLTPFVTRTTLLSSKSPLVYGSGGGLGVGSGAPALNDVHHTHYFVGRSDNFDPSQLSTDPNNARLDPEAIRVSRDGKTVFISDEYGPYIYQFDRRTGQRVRSYKLPDKYAVSNLNPVGAVEISGNTSGRVANKGMEGLAISPDGKTLFGAMQSPLIQDGGTAGANTRIIVIDVASGAVLGEFAYQFTNIGTTAKPKFGTISEIVAINGHQLLVDERDGNGLGDESVASFKKLFVIDLAGAQDVSNLTGAAALAGEAAPKTLFLDMVGALNAHGIAKIDIPAKIEGVTFGPDLDVNGVVKHTLFVANDNDFIATVTDSNHPTGIDNPNQIFVFTFLSSDLPGFVPQQLDANEHCGEKHRDHDRDDRSEHGRW